MEVYEIRTVKDFLKIPASKRSEMLADFSQWIEMCSAVDLLFRPEILATGDSFKWVDDGIVGCSEIHLRTPENPE